MYGEIDWRKIEVGKSYMYEEGYFVQAEVTVLEDISPINRPDYKSFKLRIDKSIRGLEHRAELEVGRIVEGDGLYLVRNMKFKTLGSSFDYF